MSDDALTRLWNWLDGNGRSVTHISRSVSGAAMEVQNSLMDRRAYAYKRDLATAINAALDRAEEAGL